MKYHRRPWAADAARAAATPEPGRYAEGTIGTFRQGVVTVTAVWMPAGVWRWGDQTRSPEALRQDRWHIIKVEPPA